MYIQVNLEPLDTTTAFPYLERMVNFNKSDWAALYGNLRKAQRRWGVVAKVTMETEAEVQAWKMVYNAVVQMVLIYGNESWVVTDAMMNVVEEFHHWVDIRISGM